MSDYVTVAIRETLREHGRLAVDVMALTDQADLYDAGLTSHASVNLMLALEEHFDVEFPERMLRRGAFASIAAIRSGLEELIGGWRVTPLAIAGDLVRRRRGGSPRHVAARRRTRSTARRASRTRRSPPCGEQRMLGGARPAGARRARRDDRRGRRSVRSARPVAAPRPR